MSSVANRLRGLDARTVDGVIAAALVLGCAIEALVFADGIARRLVFAGVGVAGLASIALRRSRPLAAVAVFCATTMVAGFGAPFYLLRLTTPFFAAMILIYSVGRYVPGWRGAAGALLTLTVVTVVSTLPPEQTFEVSELFWLTVLGFGPFAVGRVLADRARLQAELRDRTRELERDAELRARARGRAGARPDRGRASGRGRKRRQRDGGPGRGRPAGAGRRQRRARHGRPGGDRGDRSRRARRDAAAAWRAAARRRRRRAGAAADLAEVERLVERLVAEGLVVELQFDEDCVDLRTRRRTWPPTESSSKRWRARSRAAPRGRASAIDCDGNELRLEIRDDRRVPGGEQAALPRRASASASTAVACGCRPTDGEPGLTVEARMPLEGVAR